MRIAGAAHQLAHVLAEHGLQEPALVALRAPRAARAAPAAPAGRRPWPARGSLSSSAWPSTSSSADVEAGVVLLHDLAAPALEQIAPGLDRVEVAGVAGDRELAAPAVVVEERRAAPRASSRSSCGRYLIAAAILSWPSQNTSASTATTSPTTRLIGWRPPSSSGSTRSITTRLAASSMQALLARLRRRRARAAPAPGGGPAPCRGTPAAAEARA